MLAVASPLPMLTLDHDHHVDRPTSPVFHSPALPVFGPVQPVNGNLNTLDDLLKHPLEFKQGCLTPTSGVLTAGIAEHKYKPINEGPVSEDEDDDETVKESPSTPTASKLPQSAERMFAGSLSMTMPTIASRHPGFNNQGNTCFLNSVLQCLLHTPPLLNFLFDHKHPRNSFCMICVLRDLARTSFLDRKRGTYSVLTNLNKIAKGMRPGRQEDAHEFLRYSVDALQRSALAMYSATSSDHPNPNKIPHGLAETSWVHTIFGGRLRSRVACQTCHHCSDTFDSLLDLSVDIGRMQSQTQTLARALTQFVKPEVLSGADAYRCEKCKKPVTAEKSLTVHEAPTCLTIHLKRFTPTLRKNVNPVAYPEVLDLQPYMSKGQGKRYALYGVIHHFGSGPNSGHYTAHVKGADGRWTMMDDESVTSCANPPLNHKSAYILFYIQNDKAQPTRVTDDGDDAFSRLGSQKRTRDDMESNHSRPGWKTISTAIRTSPWDPFPASKKTRVEDTNRPKQGVAGSSKPNPIGVASTLGRSLVNYANSDDIEDSGEVVAPSTLEKPAPTTPHAKSGDNTTSIKSTLAATSPPKVQLSVPNPPPTSTASKAFSPTRPSTFYGQKKDKRPGNPFTGLSGSGNLHAKRDSSEKEIRSQLQSNMGFHHFGNARVKNRMKGKRPSL